MWVTLPNGQLLNLSQCVSIRIVNTRGVAAVWRVTAATVTGDMEVVRICLSEESAKAEMAKIRETLNRRTAR